VRAVSNYVIGTTAIHVSYDRGLRSGPDERADVRAYVVRAAQPYPAYADYVTGYIAATDQETRRDDRYAFALECILDGLAARLPGR